MQQIQTLLLAALLTLSLAAAPGCSTWGNGKLDIPEFDVGFVGPDGTPYHVAYSPDGLILEGKYTSPKTGLIYEITETGGFTVTDPRTGLTVQLRVTEEQKSESPTED